ncbi:MAG: hypothetical protein ACRDKX_01100 [Solirubrobacterales bacterium]
MRRLTITKVLALPATVAAVLAGASLSGAFNPQPDPPKGLGLIGIVEGQTLRLNAVNIALGGPDTSCRVSLAFADLEGRAIGDLENFDLQPGQGGFADLEAAAIGNPDIREGRVQVRPVARTVGNPNDKRGCRPVFSVELFGPEGEQTQVYIGDPSDG